MVIYMAIYGHIWTEFFIDARDGSAGGRVGRADVARIDEKLQEERPVLIFDDILGGSLKKDDFSKPI